MNLARQIWIVARLNFQSIATRKWQSAVIVVGMALVSGVLLSMLSMTVGLATARSHTGDPRLALILSADAVDGGPSTVPKNQLGIIQGMPGLAKAPDGSAMADPEINFGTTGKLKATGARGYIGGTGIGPKGLALRPELHIVAGRLFRPGLHELIVGVGAQARFQGMKIGDKIILPDGEWPIVGSFDTGDLQASQMFGDTDTLMTAIRRKDYNTVVAMPASGAGFAQLRRAIATNPALHLPAMNLEAFRLKNAGGFTSFLSAIVYGVGVVLAIGALFGCFNTMYAAVASRGREIATLRALGYGGVAVSVSVILEAMALSVLGALIGAGYAWARYDGVETGFTNLEFKLMVSPAMVGTVILWAIAVALIGGILPSWRAARLTVSEALRTR